MVISKLVSYIKKCHPKVSFVVRSKGCSGFGLPNIVILESRNDYVGLSLWLSTSVTDSRMEQMDKFVTLGYTVAISDDYDGLRSTINSYLSGRPSYKVMDNVQLNLVREWHCRGMARARRSLTSADIHKLYDIVEYVMRKYKNSSVLPTFGTKSGPDITIFSGNSMHKGLAIWLSESTQCYNTSYLSRSQFHHLYNMAKRSYITITGNDYKGIIEVIDDYVEGDFEGYSYLPEFQDEDCRDCY